MIKACAESKNGRSPHSLLMRTMLHGNLHFGGIVGCLFMPPLKEAGIIALRKHGY